jgi:hypothetical protein
MNRPRLDLASIFWDFVGVVVSSAVIAAMVAR